MTDGQLAAPHLITRPPRRIGKARPTPAEKRRISDALIEKMDAACEPRWLIAATANLSESQVYRRLKKLRERRMLHRAVQAVMDDTTLYG